MIKTYAQLTLLVAVFVQVSILFFASNTSPDLLAPWLAGHFYSTGVLDQIYPSDTEYFTMLPPSEWWPYLNANGYADTAYPFLYPPIWAVFFGWLNQQISFETLIIFMNLLNPALMAMTLILAWRIVGTKIPATFIVALGLGIISFSIPIILSLYQNQSQIIINFLILLGIERASKRPMLAGSALALAASIKLYPLFIAFFLLARRQQATFGWFCFFGTTIAGLSVFLAGWPLHQTFIDQLNLIGQSFFVANSNYSIDSLIGSVFYSDRLNFVSGLLNETSTIVDPGWHSMRKPAHWAIISPLITLATIITLMVFAARTTSPFFWPFAIASLAFFSPLAWSYYYIPAFVFVPLLLARFELGISGTLIAIFFILESRFLFSIVRKSELYWLTPQTLGAFTAIAFILVFLAAMRVEKCNKLEPQ